LTDSRSGQETHSQTSFRSGCCKRCCSGERTQLVPPSGEQGGHRVHEVDGNPSPYLPVTFRTVRGREQRRQQYGAHAEQAPDERQGRVVPRIDAESPAGDTRREQRTSANEDASADDQLLQPRRRHDERVIS
jgi:hypothetical protein